VHLRSSILDLAIDVHIDHQIEKSKIEESRG